MGRVRLFVDRASDGSLVATVFLNVEPPKTQSCSLPSSRGHWVGCPIVNHTYGNRPRALGRAQDGKGKVCAFG